jgi:hypothetical protein
MQFNLNYSWARSFGIATQDGIQGQGGFIYYTQRNFRLNYMPGLFDIHHTFHASGTYDLPFGKGRHYLSHSRVADYTIGGWTLGTIVTAQSGNPSTGSNPGTFSQLIGGFSTVNNTDAGVVFNGISAADFQNTVGVYRTGNPWVLTFDPKFIGPDGAANAQYLTRANTAGLWGYRPTIWGPGWYNIDLSVNKTIPIRESWRFVFQGELLNATNHPTFSIGTLNITSTGFGQSTSGNAFSGARRIEFRANLEF